VVVDNIVVILLFKTCTPTVCNCAASDEELIRNRLVYTNLHSLSCFVKSSDAASTVTSGRT
jgi:hypothetical protein